ncbi:MAG TPA: hypothetical protein VFB35_07265 [Gaiellaceae bacterium]|nr:hypothetical protein [Gaiellaceae bacterium]
MSSEANVVKDLLDRGLAPIQADMDRFAAGLRATTTGSDRPPASAFRALHAARDHALAAQKALLGVSHVYLIQGGAQAVRTFKYLADGLSAVDRGLGSTGATAAKAFGDARTLLARSSAEFRKADRALGCPYGCDQKPIPTTFRIGVQ